MRLLSVAAICYWPAAEALRGPCCQLTTRTRSSRSVQHDVRMAATPSKHSKTSRLRDLSQQGWPEVPLQGFDLVVLGSGPGGETSAVHAAQLGAKVAIIEIKAAFGGPTGLTSKAVREATRQIVQAVDNVGGDRRRQIRRLWRLRFPALRGQAEVLQAAETRDRIARNKVSLFIGAAELIPPSESESGSLAVRVCKSSGCIEIPTKKICIATGSRAHRPEQLSNGVHIPWQKGVVIDATEMGQLVELPNAIAILGGGIIAVEYATVLAKLGVGVSLLCQEKDFMPFLPSEIREALKSRMVRDHVLFVTAPVQRIDIGNDGLVRVLLENQPRQPKRLRVDTVLFSGGRDANSDTLKCEAVGVEIAKYGRIAVEKDGRTSNPNVYAVGDVTGTGLASAAAHAARSVADVMFAAAMKERSQGILRNNTPLEDVLDDDSFADTEADLFDGDQTELASEASVLFGDGKIQDAPLTLWTIPEISSVGMSTEAAEKAGLRQATQEGGSIVCGYAYYKDVARGRLTGDLEGFLKITARAEGPHRHVIIGAEIIGEGANELIQLGSILVHSEATLENVSNTPFAAVTLSALYQIACDDALISSPLNVMRIAN